MNVKLIKEFKEEFDHLLDGGRLLYKTSTHEMWCNDDATRLFASSGNYKGEVTHMIKNDEYVEFRKALAEGKTIQYSPKLSMHYRWDDIKPHDDMFSSPPTNYRVKPEEPRFEVGDFVYTEAKTKECHNTILVLGEVDEDMRIKLPRGWGYDYSSYSSSITDATKLWVPKAGEWVVYTASNSKDEFAVAKKTPQMSQAHCQPFIGSLPKGF